MTISTTWNVCAADYANASIDNLADVLIVAHWECLASDSDHPDLIGRIYGSVALGAPSPSSFKPLDSVSKADLIAWTKSALDAQGDGKNGAGAIEAAAVAALNQQISPPVKPFIPAA